MAQQIIKKNFDINEKETKMRLVKFLNSKGLSFGHTETPIKTKNDCDMIKHGNYVVCPGIIGTRCWVIFYYDSETSVYYSVSFIKRATDINDLIIHPVDVSAKKSVYQGTIMEGIYFKTGRIKNLLIDELCFARNENHLFKSKKDRLNIISSIVKNDISVAPNYRLVVPLYFDINPESLSCLYNKIKCDKMIKELIFYPEVHSNKIFTYVIKEKDFHDFDLNLVPFNMKKTTLLDVYEIYNMNGAKIDIAHIPDMTLSKTCREWFKNSKKDTLEVLFKNEKNQWIPVKQKNQ